MSAPFAISLSPASTFNALGSFGSTSRRVTGTLVDPTCRAACTSPWPARIVLSARRPLADNAVLANTRRQVIELLDGCTR